MGHIGRAGFAGSSLNGFVASSARELTQSSSSELRRWHALTRRFLLICEALSDGEDGLAEGKLDLGLELGDERDNEAVIEAKRR